MYSQEYIINLSKLKEGMDFDCCLEFFRLKEFVKSIGGHVSIVNDDSFYDVNIKEIGLSFVYSN